MIYSIIKDNTKVDEPKEQMMAIFEDNGLNKRLEYEININISLSSNLLHNII